ncbi:MAG: Hpt domain-containing protein [Brevinema sp.]
MDDWKDLIKDFLDEAYTLIESLEESLLNLEKNIENQAAIDVVFRVAHTIKGGSGAVGFDDVQ